ncbi:MAG: ammonium transporter [Actinobacteria bacterium]|nr:ammonium transporter [Actinomycetota bacterium]
MPALDSGDTGWVLVCTALVMLMTPGLAFFYGGMVRAKSVLSMLMQNYVCLAVVTVAWVVLGYTLAFGGDLGGGLLGDFHFTGLAHVDDVPPGYDLHVPPMLFMAFQLMFAVLTTALISGAVADRVRFGAFVAFAALWSVLVYAPLAHWAFAPSGWMARFGILDFAGGYVVEINCGAAALAIALVVGHRHGWPRDAMPPHSLPLTLLGAGLLWFGWFGFNAGSALRADGLAVHALVNTHLAGAGGLIAWIGMERLRNGAATTLGAASGAVAGLVAITPAGLFASDSFNPGVVREGLLYGGGLDLLGRQAVGVLAVTAFSFCATYLVARAVDLVLPLRVSEEAEVTGLDQALHSESAYDFGSVRSMGRIG